MKSLYFSFCVFCFFSYAMCTNSNPNGAPTFNVNISPPISNVVHLSPIFNVMLDSLKPYFKRGKEGFDHAHASFQHAYSSFKAAVWNHRNTIALGSVVSAYVSLQGALAFLVYKLDQNNWWSCWLTETPLESLCLIDQKELGEQLVRAIQSAYMCPENPMDLVQKFMQFLTDVERERFYLNSYIRIARALHATYLDYISYVSPDLCVHYADRLNRLAYLERIFTQWVTDYTLGQRFEVLCWDGDF